MGQGQGGPYRGQKGDGDFRLSQPGSSSSEAEIEMPGDLKPATDGNAVDRRHQGLGGCAQKPDHAVADGYPALHALFTDIDEGVEVAADAEKFIQGAGEDHDLHFRVLDHLDEALLHFLEHVPAKGVHRRIVLHQPAHPVFNPGIEILKSQILFLMFPQSASLGNRRCALPHWMACRSAPVTALASPTALSATVR